ncbi:MBL fold metallo-hydrolase [Halogeometricum sp. S1BR25-6]|uniref:MBL fold metallo-hydrolase n=1 Tax=Halogeometricum salsisoli TaxID=2950536 RepID=A0ABU2GHF4_9EURY|nr:MBL fold metallo-hydrolase [Halogeometricum sp. S1BR25-6]MDS0300251.1 MBL fold metallo-hydrolase [Halogeometricum sp. S1BR25-6]
MNISYQHANPQAGNESVLIRIEEDHTDQTACILVDAGDGIDLDATLRDDDYLAAVLLTHAHLDHYQALDQAHRDGAPIYTSPDTAAILGDVFTEGARRYNLSNTDELLDRVEPISEWHEVLGETVAVRPVPAGHTPGACGFLIDVSDGDDRVRILATGDFTERDAAAYPGLDPEAYSSVDVLFLTAATNDSFETELTDALGTIVERANAGSKTLCTASGLTGVQLATLLDAVADELEIHLPIVLAGQVAKLYDALEYQYEAITTVPTFESTAECLDHGAVTIAGPEVPIDGSSGRLFEAISDDASASLVQIQGGNTEAKTNGDFAGTACSYPFSNHPSEAVLDELVEAVSPTHVVVGHQRGRALEQYKDKWDSFSWATGSSMTEMLYEDGYYPAPPWVGEYTERRVRNRAGQVDTDRADDGVLAAIESIPEIGRRETCTLVREGVDVAAIKRRLHIGVASSGTAQTADTSNQQAVNGASNGTLYRTTGPELSDPPTAAKLSEETPDSESQLVETVGLSGERPAPSTDSTDSTAESEPAASNETVEPDPESEPDVSDSDDQADETAEDSSADPDPEPDTDATPEPPDEDATSSDTDETDVALTVEVDPAVRTLAVQRAEREGVSLPTFARETLDSYLIGVLRGDSPWEDVEPVERSFTYEADPAFTALLSTAATENGYESTGAYALAQLRESVGLEDEQTVAVAGAAVFVEQVGAVVENPRSPHESAADVVQAALGRIVLP